MLLKAGGDDSLMLRGEGGWEDGSAMRWILRYEACYISPTVPPPGGGESSLVLTVPMVYTYRNVVETFSVVPIVNPFQISPTSPVTLKSRTMESLSSANRAQMANS